MIRFFSQLWDHLDGTPLEATTFCDECAQVCTPACRRDAIIEEQRRLAYRSGLAHV